MRSTFGRSMVLVLVISLPVAVASTWAMVPDDEQWIPAAARGAGHGDSNWVTDLVIRNLGSDSLTLELTWLERGADNSAALPVEMTIEAGETRALEDVVLTVFGKAEAAGAIHLEAVESEGIGIPQRFVATARIVSSSVAGTFGQGFQGLSSQSAIAAHAGGTTNVIGVTDGAGYRSNWYGLNVTEDAEGRPAGARVRVEILAGDGSVLAASDVAMAPLEPVLRPVGSLGAGAVENATLRFTMLEGMGIFGASRVDDATDDPMTLNAHWDAGSCSVVAGEPEELDDAKVYIEWNSADDDIGVHGKIGAGGWTDLCVFDANGRRIISLRPGQQLEELSMADFFFESREPPVEEFTYDDLVAAFPEGEYTMVATSHEGTPLVGTAVFTHTVPMPPVITSPEVVEDEEDGADAVVAIEGLVVRWEPVAQSTAGDPIAITGYEVIITKVEHEDPNGFSRPIYDVHVPPDRTFLAVAEEFLEPETLYELEVLALETSGNQTIEIGFFTTE